MPCTGGCYPTADFEVITNNGQVIAIVDDTDWNDDGISLGDRKVGWIFFVNNLEVYRTNLSDGDQAFGLGVSSTYNDVNLPNGVQDVISFLTNLGYSVDEEDIFGIAKIVRNTNCKTDISPIYFFDNDDTDGCSGNVFSTVDGDCFLTADGNAVYEHHG